jgi:4-hydroxyphenylpyruvate dioxygenase-like putative hemolysin
MPVCTDHTSSVNFSLYGKKKVHTMTIQDFNYVAFIDDAAGSAAALAMRCGFKKQATQDHMDVYIAGDAAWLIHPARNCDEEMLLTSRGPAPYMIGLQSDDSQPHNLVLHPNLHLLANTSLAYDSSAGHIHYTGIDHCAIACEKGTVDTKANALTRELGFEETYRLDVDDGSSGMQSVVMASPNGKIRLPLIEPDGANSQVQVFLDQAKGMGIQHVGLSTDNIIETVKYLQKQGMRFLKIKAAYYNSEDFQSMPLSEADKTACRELNILADQNEQGGYLLQIFSEPCLGPMMIEIIERHNHNTFGARNIKSLFDTVADYQQEHSAV